MKRQNILKCLTASIIALSLLAACATSPPATPATPATPAAAAPAGEADDANNVADVNWPTRPIQVVVPFLPGGDTDMYARMFAPFLEEELGQTVTVVNIDGASGTVGATQVSMAAPDGYTVLFYHTGNMFTNVLLGTTDLNHHNFAVSNVAMHCDANILVAGADTGITSAEQFIEMARENPGSLSTATTITGFSFLLVRKMEIAGDFRTNPVDAGGAGAMAAMLLGGHTDVAIGNLALFQQYVENGDMVALTIFSEERNASLPDVPTVVELGLEEAVVGRSYFFGFPMGTDEAILRRLSDAVGNITSNPEFEQVVFDAVSMPTFFVPTEGAMAHLDEMWDQVDGFDVYLLQ